MPTISSVQTTSGPFNVRSYGAVGDGVADDSTAINAALTAAGTFAVSNGGATVVIPPGKYKINSTLVLKDNCTLMAYGAYIFAGGVVYMLNGYTTTGTGYSGGHNNLTILGGIWDAKGQDRAALDAERHNIMTFSNSRGVVIRDATFRNVPGYHAIDFNTIDGATIDGCRFEGFRDNSTTPGDRFYSEAVQIDNRSGADLPCINVSVLNCYMGPAIDGTGHGSFGKLTGSHTSVVDQFYSNIRVIGNVADDPIDVGIEGENWKNSVISGNVVTSATNDAIRLVADVANNCSGIVVSDNVCEGYGRSGISFDGASTKTFSDCTVTGNTLKTTAATAANINLEYVSNSCVNGNNIKGGTSHGILVGNVCNDVVVEGNNISEVDGHGIQTQSGARNQITNNRLYDIGLNGIYLTAGTSKSLVSSNLVIGAGRVTNNTYGALTVSTNVGNVNNAFMGNRIQKYGSGNEALTPVLFDAGSSATANQFLNNSFEGWSTTYISNFTLNGVLLEDGDRRRYIVKSADQNVTGTTLTNATDLVFAMAANAIYEVEFFLYFQGANDAQDIKVDWTLPASATVNREQVGPTPTTGTYVTRKDTNAMFAVDSASTTNGYQIDATAARQLVMEKGLVTTAGTAGNVQLRYSWFTTGTGNLTLGAGSYMRVTRVTY